MNRGSLDINAIKRSMDQLTRYREAELIRHEVIEQVRKIIEPTAESACGTWLVMVGSGDEE